MITDWINDLGPWTWLLIGFVLLGLEMLVPGVLLMWFGLAALIIGGLSLLPFADIASWTWQLQIVAFCILSGVLAYTGTRLFPSSGNDGEEDEFGDPLARFIGSESELLDEGASHVDRIHLSDTIWRVKKTGLPAGAKVRVVGNEDGLLLVEPVETDAT